MVIDTSALMAILCWGDETDEFLHLIAVAGIEVVPHDSEQTRIALIAFSIPGKGGIQLH